MFSIGDGMFSIEFIRIKLYSSKILLLLLVLLLLKLFFLEDEIDLFDFEIVFFLEEFFELLLLLLLLLLFALLFLREFGFDLFPFIIKY